jgi:hypothetical protein
MSKFFVVFEESSASFVIHEHQEDGKVVLRYSPERNHGLHRRGWLAQEEAEKHALIYLRAANEEAELIAKYKGYRKEVIG